MATKLYYFFNGAASPSRPNSATPVRWQLASAPSAYQSGPVLQTDSRVARRRWPWGDHTTTLSEASRHAQSPHFLRAHDTNRPDRHPHRTAITVYRFAQSGRLVARGLHHRRCRSVATFWASPGSELPGRQAIAKIDLSPDSYSNQRPFYGGDSHFLQNKQWLHARAGAKRQRRERVRSAFLLTHRLLRKKMATKMAWDFTGRPWYLLIDLRS